MSPQQITDTDLLKVIVEKLEDRFQSLEERYNLDLQRATDAHTHIEARISEEVTAIRNIIHNMQSDNQKLVIGIFVQSILTVTSIVIPFIIHH